MPPAEQIQVEIWLYGSLAPYGGDQAEATFAHLYLDLKAGDKMRDLLNLLGVPQAEKGITFINAVLADMPGLSADLDVQFYDGDRIGMFPTTHMWPYQYRSGARMTPELEKALREQGDAAMRHSYTKPE